MLRSSESMASKPRLLGGSMSSEDIFAFSIKGRSIICLPKGIVLNNFYRVSISW